MLDGRDDGRRVSAKDPAKRAEELRRQIAAHDHRYYVLDDPEIGDDAYDALLDELRALEAEHPELRSPDSPTQRVGGQPLDKFEQVAPPGADALAGQRPQRGRVPGLGDAPAQPPAPARHPRPGSCGSSPSRRSTGSRSRCSTRTASSFAGATRGDGVIGEDVTQNLRTIRAIPLRIDDATELIEVRGEVYFPRGAFAELNEQRAAAGESDVRKPPQRRRRHDPPARPRDHRLAAALDLVLRDRRPRGGSSSRATRRSSSG